jgi:hypothetical protein
MKTPKPSRPANIPNWMSDKNAIAPCVCGFPIDMDDDIPAGIFIDESTGLKRWWHLPCLMEYQIENGRVTDDDEDSLF